MLSINRISITIIIYEQVLVIDMNREEFFSESTFFYYLNISCVTEAASESISSVWVKWIYLNQLKCNFVDIIYIMKNNKKNSFMGFKIHLMK